MCPVRFCVPYKKKGDACDSCIPFTADMLMENYFSFV